ncbi:hypothetical protein KAT63_05410 [Candidatus Parcubacteria bacterium]|nr:hypothetical protein [Candidatus Parcubacteria bacterium]
MDHKITLKENINIREEIAWELEMDAVIFRDEFNYYLEKFKKNKSEKILESDKIISDKILVFVFIMLQIYVEYFLHQNMRRVVKFEFEHSNKSKYEEWIKNEKLNIKRKLSYFVKYFLLEKESEAILAKEEIEKIFKEITEIRNLLVHGHKISLAGNADGSYIEVSEARGYLDEDVLIEIIKNINNLGKNWNKLLDLVSSNCKSLNIKIIGDFKFDNLDYKK